MATRNLKESQEHDSTVITIAKVRFPYPDREHPNWQVYTNHPECTMGVQNRHEVLYPDIVVVDAMTRKVVMVGEVETSSSVNDFEVEQWAQYKALTDTFYLYVPSGLCNEAKGLARAKVSVTGFRHYSYRNGLFVVEDC